MLKNKRIKTILAIFFTLILVMSCTGCSKQFEYYIAYNQDAGIAHYTFAYPNNYNVTLVKLFDEEEFSSVDIYSVMDRENRTQTHWQVEVSKQKYINISDARAQQYLYVSGFSNIKPFNESTYVINGIECRDVSYMCDHQRSDYEIRLLKLEPTISYVYRYIAFEYNDMIWVISEEYSPAGEPQDPVWFNNFLDSIVIYP